MGILDIKDKVIIITGGYGVLGSSMAKHLVESGAKVAILGRNEAKAKDFAAQLSATNAIGIKADVLDKVEVKTEDITGVKFNPIDSSFSFSSFNKINYFLSAKKI